MKIDDLSFDASKYNDMIQDLTNKIILKNNFDISNIKLIAGIDLAYYEKFNKTFAVCCICVVDYISKDIVENIHLCDEITFPYIPGYLSFRELPLILKTFKLLSKNPDIVMFDGNGYLHYRNMGIATHASFYLNKPTIGVAKSYLKIKNTDFTMPENKCGAFADIVIEDKVYGRVVRTHVNVKPIFVSCGNYIDLNSTTSIVLNLIGKESRLPIPVRFADISTKEIRKKCII